MKTAIVIHTHALERTSRQPARNSSSTGATADGAPRGRGRTRVSSSALSQERCGVERERLASTDAEYKNSRKRWTHQEREVRDRFGQRSCILDQ